MLLSALEIQRGDLVCAVGGGGKTSLLYALLRATRRSGLTTVLTTTTHMEAPSQDVPRCQSFDPARLRALIAENGYCVLGRVEGTRLSPAPETDFRALTTLADVVLCEADGAHRRACKAPAAYEPVVPAEASLVVGVMGVLALGLPIEAGCHRPQIVCEVLGVPASAPLLPRHAVTLLISPLGQRKGVLPGMRYAALINQADTKERLAQALAIAHGCEQRGVRALVTAFRQGDTALYATGGHPLPNPL